MIAHEAIACYFCYKLLHLFDRLAYLQKAPRTIPRSMNTALKVLKLFLMFRLKFMVVLTDHLLVSYDEYLAWEASQEIRHINGEAIAIADSTRNHNRVTGYIFKILDNALGDRQCEVYIADVKVQVEPSCKYFYPDVVVTCAESDRDPQLVLSPCLIIEVL